MKYKIYISPGGSGQQCVRIFGTVERAHHQ